MTKTSEDMRRSAKGDTDDSGDDGDSDGDMNGDEDQDNDAMVLMMVTSGAGLGMSAGLH
jgi:hypothetical protein